MELGLPKKQRFLLYLLFLFTSFSVNFETGALVLWIVANNQVANWFKTIPQHGKLYVYLFLSSFIPIVVLSYPTDKFILHGTLLFVYLQTYFVFMQFYKGRLKEVFDIYCNFASIIAISGLVLFYLARFHSFYFLGFTGEDQVMLGDLTRARAWMSEPAYFAMYIVPALVYTSLTKGIENWKSLLFIVAGYLSFSPVFKMVLGIFLIYYFVTNRLKAKKVLLYLSCFIALVVFSGEMDSGEISEQSSNKTAETFDYYNASFVELESANLSTYSLLKNLKVSMMADSRLFGTGIGTHGHSHDLYYHSSFAFRDLNKHDAFSFGIRLFSELGVVGLVAFLVFVCFGFNKNNKINVSVLFLLLYAFFRGGHYTAFGFVFFLLLYYYTSKFKLKHLTLK